MSADPRAGEDDVLLTEATDRQIADELRRRGHSSKEYARLRKRIDELETYAALLERGLSSHEARETVWSDAE